MKLLRDLLSGITLFALAMMLIKVVDALIPWSHGNIFMQKHGQALSSIYSVGLSYLAGLIIMFYAQNKREHAKRVKEVGRDNRFDEVPESLGCIVIGCVGFIQVGIVILVLMLSPLIGFKITLPMWVLIIYGTIAGCGSVSIIWLAEHIESGVILLLAILLYPAIIAMFTHVINPMC